MKPTKYSNTKPELAHKSSVRVVKPDPLTKIPRSLLRYNIPIQRILSSETVSRLRFVNKYYFCFEFAKKQLSSSEIFIVAGNELCQCTHNFVIRTEKASDRLKGR